MTITVTVNGEPRQAPAGVSVADLVGAVTDLASGVAAAVNGEVVRRQDWAGRLLGDGDQVEIVTAVQGG